MFTLSYGNNCKCFKGQKNVNRQCVPSLFNIYTIHITYCVQCIPTCAYYLIICIIKLLTSYTRFTFKKA